LRLVVNNEHGQSGLRHYAIPEIEGESPILLILPKAPSEGKGALFAFAEI
jgi:hypothetical protein